MTKKITIFYLIATILLYSGVFYFSVILSAPVIEISYGDKIQHFFAYFILAFLTYKTTKNKTLSFIIAGTYGLSIEIIQFVIPYREFSFLDAAFNYLGAGLILLCQKPWVKDP